MGHLPRRVLGIRQGVEIDHGRVHGSRDMHRSGVVRDQQRGLGQEGRHLVQVQSAHERKRASVHRLANPLDVRVLGFDPGEHDLKAMGFGQLACCLGEPLARVAA